MRDRCKYSLTLALGSCVISAAAQQPSTMTAAGYTGLEVTPNALLSPWGHMEAIYDNQVPGVVSNPKGHNFVAGFGLLPNLEVSGRLATNNLNTNCFAEPCGVRDLSGSAKVAIPVDARGRFRIGAGATDLGGAATNFRSYYGVATYAGGPYEVSGGWAKREAVKGQHPRSPLEGPFASAALSPWPWLRGQLEYTDKNGWAGLRLFTPEGWLPQGWSAHIGANLRLTDSALTERTWFTAGLSIPLYSVPKLQQSGPALAAQPAPLPANTGSDQTAAPKWPPVEKSTSEAPRTTSPATTTTDSQLDALAADLLAKGLEDISVGRMPDGSVAVRANNASYNWNALDALGAALGSVSRILGTGPTGYRLVLTQRQVPLVGVTGQADCLRDWIAGVTAKCTAGELSTPGTASMEALHSGAQWYVNNLQPSWKTLRVRLSPVLRTRVATELGALDYSLGVNVGFEQPLWKGAYFEWRRDVPIANSDDYQPGAAFSPRRVKSETERLAFTQVLRLPVDAWLGAGNDATAQRWVPSNLTAQVTAGRIGSYFDGALGTLRWEPGQGRHRLSAEAGAFRNARFGSFDAPGPETAKPLLASYRYDFTRTRTYLEGTAGQFMNNDRGFQLGMRQWFNDVSVGLYYKRTHFNSGPTRELAGIEMSFPIGPRRDMTPSHHLQVTGTSRFDHAVETVIRNRVNAVATGLGMVPPAPSLNDTFNSDRDGLVYFEDNMQRIRDAAR